MSTQNKPDLCLRTLTIDDVAVTVALMGKFEVSVKGVKSRALHEALCNDALRVKGITIIVPVIGDTVVGLQVTITNWKSYWRGFARRHPWVSLTIILSIIRRILISKAKTKQHIELVSGFDYEAYVSPMPSGRSWGDSSESIAKTLFIGVDEHYRGMGVGKRLDRKTFDELRRQGVERLDCHVPLRNIPSIKLHHATGWRIERKGNEFFATVDLREQEEVAVAGP